MISLDEGLASKLTHDVANALEKELTNRGTSLHLVRTLTAGYTDAVVAVVKLRTQNSGDRLAILKVDRGDRNLEPHAHSQAIITSPAGFAESHLVTQPLPPILADDGWFVMFQEVAGGGANELRPLSAHSGKATLSSILPLIAECLLVEWNAGPKLESVSVQDFLKMHFKNKMSPHSTLTEWAMNIFGKDILTAPSLSYGKFSHLVNPFNQQSISDLYQHIFHMTVGNSHGDLHLENILVNKNHAEAGHDFRLIDLTTFTDSGPLSRDIVNLYVSELERNLPSLSDSDRIALLAGLQGDVQEMPASLSSLVTIWDKLQRIGSEWVANSGNSDDWKLQIQLSLGGAAIQSMSRVKRATKDRRWFFALAATSFSVASKMLELQESSGPSLDIVATDATDDTNAPENEIAHQILRAAGQFDGSCLTVLVLGDGVFEDVDFKALPVSGWNLIVEFNPRTDFDGWYGQAVSRDPALRLFTPGQTATSVSRAPIWLAATGLASPNGYVAPITTREWRSNVLPHVKKTLRSLVNLELSTIVVVHCGHETSESRVVVEEIMDASGERAILLTVADQNSSTFADFDAQQFLSSPVKVLAALPERTPSIGHGRGTVMIPTGPERDRVPVGEQDLVWFADVGQLLHSDVDSIRINENIETDFYRGHQITWSEIVQSKDIQRTVVDDLIKEIRNKLTERGTARMSVTHQPGSGGTTVVRRIAWDLHEEYPVLFVENSIPYNLIVERVRKLAEITACQCLIIFDGASTSLIDDVFNSLKAQSVPALLLVMARRTINSGSSSQTVGRLSVREQSNFARVFAPQAPSSGARGRIFKIGSPGGDSPLPFFYALNAFQNQYQGLESFVRGFIKGMPAALRDIVLDIAIAHRYGGGAIPSHVIARFLGLGSNALYSVKRELSGFNENLLIEEPVGQWRFSHVLIAKEFIRQALTPLGVPLNSQSDPWRGGLGLAAQNLIHRISEAYPEGSPEPMRRLLEKIFIEREVPDDSAFGRRLFSELLEDINSYSGRVEVLTTLGEVFPDNEHFLAHLARLRSYQGEDYKGARSLIDDALGLVPGDPVLLNIKGVIIRNEVNRLLSDHPRNKWLNDVDFREHLSSLVLEAIECFKRAESRDLESESNPLLILELVTKLLKRLKPQEISYSEFLLKRSSVVLAEAFDEAEDAVDRLERIRGDERLSTRVQEALANLHELRDDRTLLLQGWRNILDNADSNSSPVRLRLSRLYWEGFAISSDKRSVSEAIALLNDNLRDDPYDIRTIKLWLQVSRFTEIPLSRVALNVERWKAVDVSPEALFYDWVISVLLLLEGNFAELSNCDQKLEGLRNRTGNLRQRRTIFEWITTGTGISQLLSTRDKRLSGWDRTDSKSAPDILKRFEARVKRISGPTSGLLILDSGIEVFFTPAPSGLLAGRDENARVTAIVGLSYDGLRAWNVIRRHD